MSNAEERLHSKAVNVLNQLDFLKEKLPKKDKKQLDEKIYSTTTTYQCTDLAGKQEMYTQWCDILIKLKAKYPSKPKLRLVK